MSAKTCSRCGETKPATREFFGGTGTRYGGLRGRCRECEKIAKREYEATHKEERRKRDEKRAEASDGVRRSFDLAAKRDLHRKQQGVCVCCFKPIPIAGQGEVDHMVPLARGGRDDRSNLLLAHAQCNKEKHNKTLTEHWEWRVRVGLDPENLGRKHGLLP
jgi:5-methylcytosine-specific restriction endonuclease McrA